MRATLACTLSLSFLLTACGSVEPRADASPPQSPPQASVDACRWETIVQSGDRAAVEVDVEAAIARIPSSATAPDYLGEDLKQSSLKGIVLAHALLRRARTPLPLGDVAGAWQLRSVQASGDSVYDYPFFRATIARSGCGFDFRKMTGSQRRSGRLLPMNAGTHSPSSAPAPSTTTTPAPTAPTTRRAAPRWDRWAMRRSTAQAGCCVSAKANC